MLLKKCILFSVVFVDAFGWGVVVTIFAPLFLGKALLFHENLFEKGVLLGSVLAIYSLGQLIGAPILGELSDQFGRKKVLLFSLLGSLVSFVISGLAISYTIVWLLVLSRLVAGLFAANISLAQSSIVDLCTEKTKTKHLGFINLFISLGFAVGPSTGGLLADKKIFRDFSFELPFYFTALIFGIVALFYYITFSNISKKKHAKITLFSMYKNIKEVLFIKNFKILAFSFFFSVLGGLFFAIFLPSFLYKIYHFGTLKIGLHQAIFAFSVTIGLLLLRTILNYIHKKHLVYIPTLLLSFFIFIMTFIIENHILMILLVCIGLAFMFPRTALIAMASDLGNKKNQGKIFGLMLTMLSLAIFLSPLIAGFFLGVNIKIPFWLGSISLLISLVLYALFQKKCTGSNKI